MAKKRAMSSEHASEVKRAGHVNERHFATLIGGVVNRGSGTDKKDVMDKQDRAHSVKAGTWWQIFMYSRKRLVENTIFQGMAGGVADLMIACLDVYPADRADYLRDKMASKLRLQAPMRDLLVALKEPKVYAFLLEKGLFDGGNAEYLSIYPGKAKDPINRKVFHVFHRKDVVGALSFPEVVELRNSKARNQNETDDQKVILFSLTHGANMGEIEVRSDKSHYRQMKCRFNSAKVLKILQKHTAGKSKHLSDQVIAYGGAISKLKI